MYIVLEEQPGLLRGGRRSRYGYRVMQSDRNTFCRYVVLDSFNKALGDETNILDKIYKSKYVRVFYYAIFNTVYSMMQSDRYTFWFNVVFLNDD